MQKITLSAVAFLTTALPAQGPTHLYLPASLTPATQELSNYNVRPFMQTNSRVQMFFDATEAGATSFTMDELSLRYDGPIPRVGAPGPFSIQRLRIQVGTTARAQPSARFRDNLSQPLVSVFDGPWSYLPDPGSVVPHGWGDPNGSLTFPFTAPVTVTIPPGGHLVVELMMEGNDIALFGFSHAILDGAQASGGISDGTAADYGSGCSAGPGLPAATLGSTGIHAPGGAHFLNGQNLGANTLVLALLGLSDTNSSLGALPLNLAATPCNILTSFDTWFVLVSNSAGAIPQDTQAAAVFAPANPSLAGLSLYEQFLSYVPGANAPWDLVLSNGRHVTLGALAPASRGTWAVSHGADATAEVADQVAAFGYAVRLRLR